MTFVGPDLKKKFDSLSPEVQNAIMQKNVNLYTLGDLVRCLENIVSEEDKH